MKSKASLEDRVASLEAMTQWFLKAVQLWLALPPMEKNMVAKSKKTKTKSPTIKSRQGMRGGSVPGAHRVCGVCNKPGHNARSHYPGGKLAR